jgi:hypothetical protein
MDSRLAFFFLLAAIKNRVPAHRRFSFLIEVVFDWMSNLLKISAVSLESEKTVTVIEPIQNFGAGESRRFKERGCTP